MKVKRYKLVLVEWADSHGCSTHWQNMVGVRPSLTVCHSVGYLVAETRKALVIVPHVAFGKDLIPDGQGCGDMTIPRSAVRRVVGLVERGSEKQ